MLIALFEHVQCVEQHAPATLGICVRLAYDLELGEVVARQSSRGPGEMVSEEEEIVLTWWGLSRLERRDRADTAHTSTQAFGQFHVQVCLMNFLGISTCLHWRFRSSQACLFRHTGTASPTTTYCKARLWSATGLLIQRQWKPTFLNSKLFVS